MSCYHCGERQAQLKCADCDSQIFRFCSQQCGLEAHDEHLLACYDRTNAEHLEDHLFDAIEEMEDPQQIEEALDLLLDLEDQHPQAVQRAHEMIQSHLELIEKSTTTRSKGITRRRRPKRKSKAAAARRRANAKARQRKLRAKKQEVAAARRDARQARALDKKDAREEQAFNRRMSQYDQELQQTE